MDPLYSNQPLVDRLRKVQDAYRDSFPTDRQSGCALWLVENQDEANMVTAMALTEDTPGAVFDDLFLPLLDHVGGAADYPAACGEEIRAHLAASAEELLNLGVDEALWTAPPQIKTLGDVAHYAVEIARQFPRADRAVLLFHPRTISDHQAFTRQIESTLNDGLPEGSIIMVCAGLNHRLSQRLPTYGDTVTVLRPDLRMDEAPGDVLASGDLTNPSVRFNQLYAEMTRAGGNGDLPRMRDYADRALACADNQSDFEHVGVTVLMAKASILMAHPKQREEAIQTYQQARARAAAALSIQGEHLRPLLVQAILGEANGYYYQDDYAAAAGKYKEAAAAARGDEHAYLRYECLRMTVDCYARTKRYDAAYSNGLEALSTAEHLSEALASQSTLPYLGEQLLDLADRLNRAKNKPNIQQRVAAIAGDEWRPR